MGKGGGGQGTVINRNCIRKILNRRINQNIRLCVQIQTFEIVKLISDTTHLHLNPSKILRQRRGDDKERKD